VLEPFVVGGVSTCFDGYAYCCAAYSYSDFDCIRHANSHSNSGANGHADANGDIDDYLNSNHNANTYYCSAR
jgi:hypothetical protein